MPGPWTPQDWHRLEGLLDRLLDTPPEHRAALIAELSGGDPERRAELERLLVECERDVPLLEQPAGEAFAALLDDPAPVFPAELAGRYRPARLLGSGGMASVFLARDLKHGRDVAVKIMRPTLAASLGRDRFLREIGIAAQLRHPHIVPLFDSGDAGGALYYVMPYEEGHSLRERLSRGGPLPVADALAILQDVCAALAHSHERGIVHRDIKPDNVLLAGRTAMVTDFGVARAISAAAPQDSLTAPGGALGTPGYMAPEQLHGGAVDHRADLYAFGVMAYEMLEGERPPAADMLGSAGTTVEALRSRLGTRNDLPAGLAGLVCQCLALVPDERPSGAAEVLARLQDIGGVGRPRAGTAGIGRRWRVGGAGLAAVGAVAVVLWALWPASRREAPVRETPRLAVMVFQYGSDLELEPLAMGLTENLIGALGEVPGLIVRSLQAVLPFRDSLSPPQVLGRRLDVGWLVVGQLYRVDERVVATVQLTEAETGRLVARSEAGAARGQSVGLIEDLVPKVATMLRERLGDEVRLRDWRAGTRSDEAFAAVNRAHLERREANRLAALRDVPGAWLRLQRADRALDSATRADPRWVEPPIQRAVVALNAANMLFGSGYLADSVPAILRAGVAQAEGALRLDPRSLRAKELLGILWHTLANRSPAQDSAPAWRAAAERWLTEISDADTSMVDALTVLATIHFARGEYERAYVLAERAFRADAFARDPQEVLGRLFSYSFEAEEDVEARRWCEQYRSRLADDWFGGYCLLTLMVWDPTASPEADSALALARQAAAVAPRVIRPSVTAQLQTLAAGVLARRGAAGEARRLLASVATTIADDPDIAREPFGSDLLEFEAGVRLRLGEHDRAASLLRALLARHPDRAARLARSRRFRGLALEGLDSLRR